ncbi:MAG: RNA polymerase sigma factor [Thermoguttaceae bacterium]
MILPPNHGKFWDEWQKIVGKVRAACEKLAHRKQDAEEIFSLTRLAACENFAGFSGRSTFYTWVIGIAHHKGADLAKQRIKRRQREQSGGNNVESLLDRHESSGPFAADIEAWLVTLAPRAADAGHLKPSEAAVLSARLGQPNARWGEIAKSFRRGEGSCKLAFERAIGKLAVYLILHCPDSLGGLREIRAALDAAKADAKCALTPHEVEAFEKLVLNAQIDHHQRRWQTALRSACTKVCRQIDWKTLPPPPGSVNTGQRPTLSKKIAAQV